MKYAAIQEYRDRYSIERMCTFFGVSRSGYYAYLKRLNHPDKDKALAQLIVQCQHQVKGTYGYRRVCIWLERQGLHVNHKRVLRIMRKYNLLAQIRRKRRYPLMEDQLHRYENLLNRDFSAGQPNQKWATDISYIKTGQGTLYLSMIRDLYDKSIVAYKTATAQSVKLVLDTIKDAMDKEKVAGSLYLHSDQGFQYTSDAYFTLTQGYGISPSMSRRANPIDNAMAENFFGILKAECIQRHKLYTFAQAQALIDEYIYFYNHQRIQTKTKLTPLEMRRQHK